MTSSLLEGLRGEQHPRILYAPKFSVSSGPEAVECARLAGLLLDPWQELSVHTILGERPDGKWAAFETGECVPRQNGKGAIIECLELAGIYVFGERLIIHSAHEFATARAAFRRLEELIAGTPEFSRKVQRISRTNGDEGFDFFGGQQLRYRTRTKSGGRGLTGDRVILDEAMILQETTIGNLMPTMAARSIQGNPQLNYFGSSVDQEIHEHGVVFSRIRHRAVKGDDPSLVWLEWSIEGDSPDELEEDALSAPAGWAKANPSLGIRISTDFVAKEHRSMTARMFATERVGVGDWPSVDEGAESVFDPDVWRSLLDATSEVKDPVVFGFDVSPNRSRASIGVAGRRSDGMWHAELIERRHGTDWVPGRLGELRDKYPDAYFACDGKAAKSLLPEIEALGIEVEVLDASEQAMACGFMFDAVDQRTVRVVPAKELNAAVKGAVKRELEDSFAWSRKNSHTDITPLVAVTDALWVAHSRIPTQVEPQFAWA